MFIHLRLQRLQNITESLHVNEAEFASNVATLNKCRYHSLKTANAYMIMVHL